MRINAMKLGLASATATLLAWIACSLAVALAPGLTMEITAHLLHIEPSSHDWALTWGSFAMGAICWTGFAFLFAFAIGASYNTFSGEAVAD